MRYYVVSDIHGYYSQFMSALEHAGFNESGDSKLIICGDLFDRGREALALQSFVLRLMGKDKVILIKGNHESLMIEMIRELQRSGKDITYIDPRYAVNGTLETAMQLTRTRDLVSVYSPTFAKKLLETPFLKTILPAMKNYFETPRYIFVHGWIPCENDDINSKQCSYDPKWRQASDRQWEVSRWQNGINACMQFSVKEPGKTIVCGHWHASYGHYTFGNASSEFELGANFSPFYSDGIIAIDGCTALSGQVNCVVIED